MPLPEMVPPSSAPRQELGHPTTHQITPGPAPLFSCCKPIDPSQSAAISILLHRAPNMPCTAGIKVTAAYVGMPASGAHMMMGWNAMTAKHKELHAEVQQAHWQGLVRGIQFTVTSTTS